MMFWNKRTKRTASHVESTEVDQSLHLSDLKGETTYHLPLEMVQSLRLLVTRLQRDDKLIGKLSVIAAHRQEGVSLTALALATTMAHDLPKTVCLVDLNWWWPSQIMRDLGGTSVGLAAALQGKMDWQQVMVRTSLPNLYLLPAGEVASAQRPVVARSNSLETVIEELSQAVDHVVLDIPAVLATSDAVPLAGLGDACCLTIKQGVSSRTTVTQALTEMSHVNILGVILNQTEFVTPNLLLKWIPEG